jgi:hypothetical protein
VTRGDYDAARRAWRWPIREVLVAFADRMREEAMRQYQHDTLIWALLAPHTSKKMNPPVVPAILKETDGDS